ncbi:MAG: tetratricopeptide repeat protein [Treponema sp.]
MLHTISEAAVSNGAIPLKTVCAALYQFTGTTAAPVFSANLFLQFLADILNQQKKRLMDYRIIIDVCEDTAEQEALTDYFARYKTILTPNRGFFASPQAEQLLKPYLHFRYLSESGLYGCTGFIVPKPDITAPETASQRIYIPENSTWFHAVYHFMLLHPINDSDIETCLSENEKKQYSGIKNVRYYFRRRRFCSSYPDYFEDVFMLYTSFYFRAFMKRHPDTKPVIYTAEKTAAVKTLLHILPSAAIAVKSIPSPKLHTLPQDFIHLVYLVLYASRFIFEDEMKDFFASMHKSTAFIISLYEWMYALGITEVKSNSYSAPDGLLPALEQCLGSKKRELDAVIAAFLWKKYQAGELCPDTDLNSIFLSLSFKPDEHFTFHYFLYEHSDTEIQDMDIRPLKQERFFPALEHYQKALRISSTNTGDALYAVKNALSAVQKNSFIAGEYRILSYIALLHLSQSNIEDAVTYFQYALDNAERLHDTRFICETLFQLSISYFLQSNLTGAFNHLNRLQQAVTDYFEQPYKIPGMFMQGRTALQLGDYRKAESFFEQAAETASPYFTEWEPLCRVWYARTLSQKGETGKAQSLLRSYIGASSDAQADVRADARVFLLESFLLSPVLRNEVASEIFEPPQTVSCAPIQSGFSLAEDMIWRIQYGKPAVAVLHGALENYYRFRLAAAAVPADGQARTYLQKLEETAREALRYRDIYAPLYLYLCYDSFIRLEGADSDTANGYLSRSFKALQNNMRPITENTIRDTFILRNVWNAKLYAAAQQNKLV